MVEVPTIVSYSSPQQRTAEQIIDIPVPHGRGRAGQAGLRSSSQGQGSTAFRGVDLVDIPVPRRGGLHGPASAASSSHSSGAVDVAFPQSQKSARLGPHSGRNWVRTLLHGLRRLMATSWRSRMTSLRLSRSWSRSPRRTP